MHVEPFFDPPTSTLTYVVHDEATGDAVLIDPVLEYDPLGSRTSTNSVECVARYVRSKNLRLHYVLETHAHADHLSGSQYFRRRFEAKLAIGAGITEVQQTFKRVFDLPDTFAVDGSQFDRLIDDGEALQAGSLRIEAIATPGHTPACLSYRIGDAVFTGDALFLEDFGTGRCDFPRGDAEALYHSVHDKLYALPDETRVFVGHDYQPGGRPLRWETTIGKQKAENLQLRSSTPKEEFVAFRRQRDAALPPPRLLFESVQVNIDAGKLPPRNANGVRHLRIPLDLNDPTEDDGSR
jgi:glyoxylase-like metal-dependent hydrolase (beta-lactamase superfamily II)